MAIGERIRFFRNLRGMTQKYLGQLVGFSAATADIRMAQYEAGKKFAQRFCKPGKAASWSFYTGLPMTEAYARGIYEGSRTAI